METDPWRGLDALPLWAQIALITSSLLVASIRNWLQIVYAMFSPSQEREFSNAHFVARRRSRSSSFVDLDKEKQNI